MKKINIKNKESQQSEKNKDSVAMIVYLNRIGYEPGVYWANFNMDSINFFVKEFEESSKSIPELRNHLWDIITNHSLSPNPDAAYYSVLMTYIIGNSTIKNKIQKFPDGGWGIIAHYNYDDQSDQKYQFLNPVEFQKQVNSDFTFIPFNGKNVGITFEEDSITCENLEEALFLSSLVELIKISDNMYCHLCNEELLRRFPGPLKNRQWISKMLGKFSSLGILEISTYEINGSIWYRDINLIYPANHILFVMEQKLSA